jgi:hypothetical protein
MNKETVKQGFDEAQNSLREKQVAEVKQIVLETLKKIDLLEKDKHIKQSEIKELDGQIKILRSDIDDLKEGRIDRIVERQEKDPKAINVSVVVIIKEKEVIREPWYQPYVIEKWNTPVLPYLHPIFDVYQGATSDATITKGCNCIDTINCSISKFATVGTYDVNGTIVNLR